MQAFTGSHRVSVAQELGVSIPVIRIDQEKLEYYLQENDITLDEFNTDRDVIERELPKFDQTAAELFKAEVDIEDSAYEHEAYIKQAVKRGKPVPAEVLADYPDLVPAKAPEPTPPPAETPPAPKAKIGRKGVTKKAPATVVIKDEIDMNLIRPRYLELNKKSQTAEGLTEDEKAEVVRIDAALSEYRAKSDAVKKIGSKGVTKKPVPPAKPAAVETPAKEPWEMTKEEFISESSDVAMMRKARERENVSVLSNPKDKSRATQAVNASIRNEKIKT